MRVAWYTVWDHAYVSSLLRIDGFISNPMHFDAVSLQYVYHHSGMRRTRKRLCRKAVLAWADFC